MKIASLSARCFRGSPRRRPIGRCPRHAATRRCPIITRTICDIEESPSGISRVSRFGNSRSGAGHARASMSLDVYSHVMPPDEIASERFLALAA